LRASSVCGVLLILLVVLASPISVQAAKKMTLMWSGLEVQPASLEEQGNVLNTTVLGSVLDQDSHSAIPGATISIQVDLTLIPLMAYDHATITYTNITTATTYTNTTGKFQTTFLIPIPLNSTAFCTGNEWFPRYFITLVADKAGYDPARGTMFFPVSAGPYGFLSMETSPSKLTIGQGQSGLLTVTIKSLERDQPVNLTAINLPEGVTVQFDPSSPTGGGLHTIEATVYVSHNAPVGNHTVTILANSWLHVCIQLVITATRTVTRPATSSALILTVPLICAIVAILVLAAIAVSLRRVSRYTDSLSVVD